MSKRPMGIKDVYNDNVDIRLRIAYVLSLTAVVGNTAGFLANFALYGTTLPSVFCGVCACAAIFVFTWGLNRKDYERYVHLLIGLLVVLEFPFLVCVYGAAMYPYLLMGFIGQLMYVRRHRLLLALTAGVYNVALVVYTTIFPFPFGQPDSAGLIGSTIVTFTISSVGIGVLVSMWSTINILDKLKRDEKSRAALETAYHTAEMANHAKSDFLSRMSHDIRTPMNAIVGLTTIMSAHLDDSERIRDCLDKISSSSRHLLGLINQVLDMSQIESGKLTLSESEFSLTDMVNDLTTIVQSSAQAKGQQFQVELRDLAHNDVCGDRLRLQQVFMNILGNAVKYTGENGHITMTLSELPGTRPQWGEFEFICQDDGIGMSPEFIARLFDPFERAEDERVGKIQGTGLGMAITYSIVQLMGGSILVDSEPNAGSRFTIRFSLKLQESPTADEKTATLEPLSQDKYAGRKALLVEDNELNREIAREILEMTGLEVETAENGREAVELCEAAPAGRYDIIFMDIQMPVMNGFQATGAIRALPGYGAAEIPIIAMSANAFREDVQAALHAGMNQHVGKPLDLGQLMAVLRKWLGRKA